MVGVIDGFRWCILGGQSPLYLPGLAVSVRSPVLSLVRGPPVPQDGKELCRPDLSDTAQDV